jgi:hypothetical protein
MQQKLPQSWSSVFDQNDIQKSSQLWGKDCQNAAAHYLVEGPSQFMEEIPQGKELFCASNMTAFKEEIF